MKTLDTIAGKMYVVMSPNGGTVTSADGLISETVEAGKQKIIIGTGAQLQLDDAAGKIIATFNYAPAKLKALGLLGGGSNALPAGYLAAEFLESTGKEYIDTDIPWTSNDILRLDYATITDNPNYNIFGVNNNYRFLNTSVVQMVIKNSAILFPTTLTKGKHSLLFDTTYRYVFDGEEVEGYRASWTAGNLTLFSISAHTYNAVIRFFKFTHENEAKVKLIPAISPQGEPCLVDTESKKAYKNNGTGAFIVGLTLSQARKLSKLPAGGGALTVSLPSNWQEDEGVQNAKSEAEAKGWQITVRTYDAEAGAAVTFALRRTLRRTLRRIWVRKTLNEYGSYVAADGSRWSVDWCVDVWGAEPEELGYEAFHSVDAAIAYWELEPYLNPEEELLTEYNEK